MSDTTSSAAQGQPPVSDEQLREYVQQLRPAPAEQVVTELLSGLLNAAQAKLGRRDARLLIDLSGVLTEHVRRYVSADLTRQVDNVLGQLRLAQVRAEEAAAAGQSQPEPNDLPEVPQPPAGAPQPPAGTSPPAATPPPQQPPRSPVSGLWIPGRDF